MSALLQLRRAAMPAIISGSLLIATWWLLRMSWSSIDLVQGSFLFAAVVVTFVAIAAGAAIEKFSTACVSVALQILAAMGFILMVTIDSRAFGVLAFFRVTLVLAAWIAACSALPFLLRKCRFGAGAAIIAPSILAALLLAFPAVVVPAHRALASPGSTLADRFVGAAVYGCPIYGMFNATAGEMPSPWPSGKNRVMYQLTIFDQNAANPRADWLLQAHVFFVVAIGGFGAAFFLERRKQG